jgi:FkbM family methyltransferase
MAPFASKLLLAPFRRMIHVEHSMDARKCQSALFDLLMRGYTKLFAKKRWYRWNKLLFNLSLRGLGILTDEKGSVISRGEERLLRALAAQWGARPTVLDVGAHHGEFSNIVRRLSPQALIYAFEPSPTAFEVLQRNAAAHGYVAANLGCGEKAACMPLFDYTEAEGSVHASVYPEVISTLHRGRPVSSSITLIALDDFIREHTIETVDFLKIDTEGYELMVLAGLRATLAQCKIDVVQFEFNAMNVISRAYCRDFYEILGGYDLYRILPDGLVPLGEYRPVFCEIYAYQNIVGIRKDCGIKVEGG